MAVSLGFWAKLKNVGHWIKKIGKSFFFRGLLLCIVILLALLTGGAYVYYLVNQEQVHQKVHAIILEKTGLSVMINGHIAPQLFPPGVVVHDVVLHDVSPEKHLDAKNDILLVKIDALRAHLDFFALFSGRVRLSLFEVDSLSVLLPSGKGSMSLWESPDASLEPDAPEQAGQTVAASGQEPTAPTKVNPKTHGGPRQQFRNLKERAAGLGPEPFLEPLPVEPKILAGLQEAADRASLFFQRFADVAGQLRVTNGSLVLLDVKDKEALSVSNLQIDLQTKEKAEALTLSATITVPVADLVLDVQFAVAPGDGEAVLSGILQGKLQITPYQSPSLSGTFALPFVLENSGRFLTLKQCAIAAEGDSLNGEFIVDLATQTATGAVDIHQLSLSRWFAFSRNLPPGIQRLLHSINASFDFVFDGKGVHAYNLQGTAAEVPITGYVGASDLTVPVVRADIALDRANVDMLLPVLATEKTRVPEPEEPSFPHPPLAPYPEKPLAEGEEPVELIDVGYDIRIFAEEAQVHELGGGPIQVLVQPQANDVCRVSFTAENLAEGHLQGWLDIDRPSVAMHFETMKVNLALLPENFGSSVQMAGLMTGVFDIGVPVSQGSWGKDWKMTSTATIDNFSVASAVKQDGWHVLAGQVQASNSGSIHAVRKDGISIGGDWRALATRVSSSWNPTGEEQIESHLQGTISWPKPIAPVSNDKQKSGIDRVQGNLEAKGSLTVRLGSVLVPISGVLKGALDWQINDDRLTMEKAVLDGLGSYTQADVELTFTPNDVIAAATTEFKLAPRVLLDEWDLLPGKGVTVPEVITGTSKVFAKDGQVSFQPLVIQADGAPLQGYVTVHNKPFAGKGISGLEAPTAKRRSAVSDVRFMYTGEGTGISGRSSEALLGVSLQKAAQDLASASSTDVREAVSVPPWQAVRQPSAKKNAIRRAGGKLSEGYWTISLSGSYVDIDKFFPPKTPEEADLPLSAEPWNLSFLEGLNMDLELLLEKAKFQHMHLRSTKIRGKLIDKRFALVWETKNYYEGAAYLEAEGWFTLPSQVTIDKAHVAVNSFQLDKALFDYNKSTSYGGIGNFTADVTGMMRSDADFPAGLSGAFTLRVKDGLYPAFIGSEMSGLRNIFSEASLSGPVEKGVLRWKNFLLKGVMVDMTGEGWVDFPGRTLDIRVSATFAKVPTIPVRISGTFASPSMYVRGAHMVVQTAQAAGGTVIDLFQGILELPVRAAQGVGDLFSSDQAKPAEPSSGQNSPPKPVKRKPPTKTERHR